jgi:hypothetical protein
MKLKVIFAIFGVFMLVGCDAQDAKEADLVSQNVNKVVSEKPAIVTPIPTDLNIPETIPRPVERPVVDKPAIVTPEPLEETETVTPETSTEADETPEITLAKCLTASGAKLYTASWCGHCKNQKAAFGAGLEYLKNTECADGDGWAQACTDAGVKAVPTWIFGNGTTKSGNTPLATLAELNGCKY